MKGEFRPAVAGAEPVASQDEIDHSNQDDQDEVHPKDPTHQRTPWKDEGASLTEYSFPTALLRESHRGCPPSHTRSGNPGGGRY